MADLTRRERCEKRLKSLKTIRLPFEPQWRDTAELVLPSHSKFLYGTQTNLRGGQRQYKRINRRLYNGHGTAAFRTLCGGMTSGLSSPSRPWFRLTCYDSSLLDDQQVKDYIDEVEKRMYAFLSGTNFYACKKYGYSEIGLFGTAAGVMVEDVAFGAVCHPLSVGEYWIAVNHAQVPDALYRQIPMTVVQAVQRFGKDKVSTRISNAYDAGNYDDAVQIMHAIEPNDELQIGKMTAKGKPWSSIYWDTQDGDSREVLLEEGYNEQPFWAPRWGTQGGDVYGSDCPGFDCLADLRELQLQTKRKTDATAKLYDPEMVVPAALNLTGKPGNRVAAARVDKDQIVVPYAIPYQAIEAINQDVERCTRAVDTLSYADLFMAITNMEGIQPRNIQEIASRNEEKLTQLGPVIERVNTEDLQVSVERTFGIMARAQMLPPAPPHLQGAQLKIQFVSILAQMQRMIGIGQLEQTVSFIGNLAAANPEAMDKLDVDAAIDEYADRAGAPTKVIRSENDVQQLRAQRAQQQNMKNVAAMMPAAKDGAAAAQLLTQAGQNHAGIAAMTGQNPPQ